MLVRTARQYGKEQIAMIMETMCATGIRVSELKFFRVENIKGGVIRVWNKGKYRMVILPEILRKKLLIHIRKKQDPFGSDIPYPHRPGKKPLKYMERNESNRRSRGGQPQKGIPAQSSSSVCTYILYNTDHPGGNRSTCITGSYCSSRSDHHAQTPQIVHRF